MTIKTDPKEFGGGGRSEPYTEIGISRMLCARAGCGNKATQQWQVCADGSVYRPVCTSCDVALNMYVLRFFGDPDRFAKIEEYGAKMRAADEGIQDE